ncbi:DUF6923 family protein [Microbacterium halotolerans]|uniref:DUF7927 domain-containing protein n=1 Tax=Microbacterium halotolerans TaxID=246613 RepID=UPI000E6AA77E|nr:GEVED domain-containing protein [Microbacterium halotolerans]
MIRRSTASLAAVCLLAAGLITAGAVTAPQPASAEPGSPGVTEDPTVVFEEGFENRQDDEVQLLGDYVGAEGQTYSADVEWSSLEFCNGFVLSPDSPNPGECPAWNGVVSAATAMQAYNGSDSSLAAYTAGDPGVDRVQLATDAPIQLDAAGRFLTFSVDAVAVNCGVSAPLLRFYLGGVDGGETPVSDAAINPCAEGGAAGTFASAGSFLSDGDEIDIVLRNENGSGAGNDHAIDNIRILDATPKLDKEFGVAEASSDEAFPLTFTVTNTSELAAKDGWSFSDELSDGLVVAGDPAISSSCTADVAAEPGSSVIEVTNGVLAAGETSCDITVDVVAADPGEFTNDESNITTLVGLDPPGDSTVVVTDPEPLVCEANGPGLLNQDTAPNVAYEVDLVTGGVTTLNENVYDSGNVNATGYNVLDGYVYGWYHQGDDGSGIARIDSAGDATLLGRPDGMTDDTRHVGDVDASGHYWVTGWGIYTNPDQLWYQVDLDPDSATYLEVLDSDEMAGDIEDVYFADWAYVPGAGDYLWTMARIPSEDVNALYRFDTATGELERAMTGDFGDLGRFGAVYADPDGFLYASDNGTGDIYRVDVTADEPVAELFTQGPASNQNDGARCALSPIWTDYGDAPESYATLLADDGPRHGLKALDPATGAAPLMLGGSVDHETDGQPTGAADGDTADDGVADPIVISIDAGSTVAVTAVNDTAEAAVLAGWIDLDRSGSFDEGELVTVDVPANSGSDEYELSFGPAATVADTFARFRLIPAGEEIAPTGPVSAGEVEDYAVAVVLQPELEIDKSADVDGLVQAGDVVEYTVTLSNTGDGDFTAEDPAGVTDDMSDVLDDAAYNGDVTATASDGSEVPEPVVDGADLSWSGPIAAGETVTITYSVTVTNSGDHDLVNAAVPQCTDEIECPDPTPPVEIPLPHVTPEKSSDPASGENVLAGDVITYTVSFVNDGQATGPVDATDDLSGVLDDADVTSDPVVDEAHAETVTAVFDPEDETIRTTGELAAGETATVTYQVTVRDDGDRGDNVVGNVVVPDVPPFVPEPGCDDCDPFVPPSTDHPVGELDDWKTVDPASGSAVQTGEELTYTLHFENIGEAPVDVNREDALSGVLDDATVTAQPESSDEALTVTEITDGRFGVTGTLEVGQHVTVSYTVTVNAPAEQGDGQLLNAIVDPGEEPPTDPGVICVPAEGERADCTTNDVDLPALDVTKSATPAEGVGAGDTVKYTVTLTNTGDGDFTAELPAGVFDDMSDVLDDAAYNGDVAAASSDESEVPEPIVDGAELSWSGALAAGETVTITYSVTVTNAGDHDLVNLALPQCVEGLECPPPPASEILLPHVTPAKSSDPATGEAVVAGDTITYTLSFVNDGQAAGPVDATDDLSGVLDDADLVSEPVVDEAHAETITTVFDPEDETIRTTGELAAGDTVTVTYQVTVRDAADRGDDVVGNVVVPDRPPFVPDPDCEDCAPFEPPTTRHPVGALDDWKTVDPASGETVEPGDEVTYTLHFENVGEGSIDVDREDVLDGVLDDATVTDRPVVSDEALTVTEITEGRLGITGTLEAGQLVTVSYTVAVGTGGDGSLYNVIVDPGEEPPGAGECPTAGERLDCTVNPVAGSDEPLAVTGGQAAWGILAGGLTLLLAGGALMAVRRQRRLS